MGVNIAIQTETFSGNEDRRWLGTRMGTLDMRSGTLDLALFNAEHYALGYIKSGILLGKVTATGLYGPYSPLLANGLETSVGHLWSTLNLPRGATTGKFGFALFWRGVVKTAFLPSYTGTGNLLGELDAAGRVDMATWIRYED